MCIIHVYIYIYTYYVDNTYIYICTRREVADAGPWRATPHACALCIYIYIYTYTL